MGKIFQTGIIGHTGQGEYGHYLHRTVNGLPGFEAATIADPDEAGREWARSKCGARKGYADYRDMLSREELDLVIVCPRHLTHKEAMVTAAAEAGCHVYCEKPIAADPASADRMLSACRKNGVRIAVAHQSRYVEPFLSVKRKISEGEIGDLVAVQARGKEDHRGGGEDLMVLGTHLLDMMRFFAGDPDWVFGHVTEEGREMKREDARAATEPMGPVAGDSVLGVFGFQAGVHGTFRSVRNRAAGGKRWGVSCLGTEGVISILYADTPAASICRCELLVEKGGIFEALDIDPEPDVPGAAPLETVTFHTRGNRLAVCDLMKAAEEDREPLSSGRDALFALEMIMGIYRSHLEERRIPFPLSERSHPLS